ncbi:MAG: VCBS repeat-containing protein [Acidobacteria bacterium]|nr:VCBS repeat-containing protein [Acidobacteriota bacterium]MBI3656751.1 VCBS repeat-containing protein [Acidobacteriota bacterium]
MTFNKRKMAVAMLVVLTWSSFLLGEFPYPRKPDNVRPQDFERYMRLPVTVPPTRPNDFQRWKYTSDKTDATEVRLNPHELGGVIGMSVDLGWQVSTGRPDTLIAVLDSGIKWNDRGAMEDLVRKTYLNRGELPEPQNSQGLTKRQLIAMGQQFQNPNDLWDLNDDGIFNMVDYASDPFDLAAPHDPRLRDLNGNGFYDPQDLLKNPLFADGVDNDGNGYIDDIAGWNFLDNNNDPFDEVQYGHGTGEARDSTAEANNGHDVGVCPNCMALHVRVGDSFIADTQAFAQGVVFAVDSGADVVQEALGTINNSTFAQDAINYAYRHHVPVIASAADEESFHHNFPAANNRTITVNSVTKFVESGQTAIMYPRSYLYLNGCTNFGGNIALSISSSGCSSEATGRGSGIAGLIVSAARNEVALGNLSPYQVETGGRVHPVSANEVRQLMTMTADDINFPPWARGVFLPLPLVNTKRFPSQEGWDQYFGYGRANVNTIMRRIAEGRIPPEADIESPGWWETIDPLRRGLMDIVGTVAARRAERYQYRVTYGCGIQPREAEFETIYESASRSEAMTDDVLATWDTINAARACGFDYSAPPTNENSFAVTLRIQVVDNRGIVGEARRTVFLHHDEDLTTGAPITINGSGEASPLIATLTPGDAPAIIVSTGDGLVYALRHDGTLLPGWPVHTDPLPIHLSRAFRSGELSPAVYESIGQGGVAVGDLDGDGQMEIVTGSLGGKLYVWEPDGTRRPGFPVITNPLYSQPSIRNPYNRLQRGIAGSPVLADLDGDGKLEIIASAMDRHLYVWRENGDPQPGWPLLVIDRTKIRSIDPVTHQVDPLPGANQESKILSTPAVGDIDGDGRLEIVVGTNEEYKELVNFSVTNPLVEYLVTRGGDRAFVNSRLYAIPWDGNNNPYVVTNPAGPYKDGWPAKIGVIIADLLPWIVGITGSPTLVDLDHDGKLEVVVASVSGPGYVLRYDGTSYYGASGDGRYKTLAIDFPRLRHHAKDSPTIPGIGSLSVGDLDGLGNISIAAPAMGLGRALDSGIPASQTPAESHVLAWDAETGRLYPAFPQLVEDMQFFNQPIIADLDNDGLAEIIEGSGGYLVHAYNINGREPAGWPKFTGGWITASPAVGDIFGDGTLGIVETTREGRLYIWRSPGGRAEGGSLQWPRYHHNNQNTSLYTRPR